MAYIDEIAEYRLLGSIIDRPQSVLAYSDSLFTGDRVRIFSSMKKAYLSYGEISYEGIERFFGKMLPPDLEMGRGAKPGAIVDRLIDLATKRQLSGLINDLTFTMISSGLVDRNALSKKLSLPPVISSEDSTLDSGITVFASDLARKRSGNYQFVSTGLEFLNYMLGGEWPRQALTVVIGQPGGGKCIDGDVLFADGVYRHVSTVCVGDMLMSYNEHSGKIVPKRVLATWDAGMKIAYTLTTRRGLALKVSDEHPFLTQRGWVRADQLEGTDYIATAYTTNIADAASTMSDDLLKVLAYLIGDGTLGNSYVRFTHSEPVASAEFCASVVALGDTVTQTDYNDYSIRGGKIKAELDRLGLRHGAAGKFIPDCIFTQPLKKLSLFLSRLYSTDGWASVGESKSEIGYSTVSKRLAYNIVAALNRFGIAAKLRKRHPTYTYKGERRQGQLSYSIIISDNTLIEKFIREIGIYGKEAAVDAVQTSIAGRLPIGGNDVIPRELLHVNSVNLDLLSSVQRNNLKSNRLAMHRSTLITLASIIPEWEDLAVGDIFWDRVRFIEKTEDIPMWDLEVEDTHNFIANGIVAHNTALVVQSILNMAKAGIPSLFLSLEMPKDKIISRMVANIASIDGMKIKSGDVTSEDLTKIDEALAQIQALKDYIHIVATPGLTVEEIMYQVKLHKEQFDIQAFFVDYIQIIDRPKSDNDVEVLGYIAQQLRNTAVNLDIAAIALSQKNGQEGLQSVWGSRRIVHIADSIFEIELNAKNTGDVRDCTLNFHKNRDGAVGQQNCLYIAPYLRFT